MSVLTAWLLMLPLHASVLLLVAWAIDTGIATLGAWRELLWRTALFGCLLTATVQAFAPQSFIGRWHWAASAISIVQDARRGDVLPTAPASDTTVASSIPSMPPTPAGKVPSGRSVIQTPVVADSTSLAAIPIRIDWTHLAGRRVVARRVHCAGSIDRQPAAAASRTRHTPFRSRAPRAR